MINNKKLLKRLYNVVVVAALLGFIGVACGKFMVWGNKAWTDDAQVYRHITPINARVGGFIKEVRFGDYQHVKRGDTLVIIDDAEYRLQLAQAEAALRGTQKGSQAVAAGMNTTQAGVRAAQAAVDEARVQMDNARREYERYEQLLSREAVTRQQYDNMKALYEAACARYEQARSRGQQTSAVLGEQNLRRGQNVEGESVAEAQLNLARLNLGYTVVVATCDGVTGRKDIHEGQLIQPGQQLCRIVDSNEVWVVANYRETQLKHIQVGNSVELKADAVPGINFKGEVQSVAAATGSAVSPIPVDNATGNFVKVEQRVPVRIVLTADNKAADVERLLAGMNVETIVKY